jgi:DNA-binding transcriptional ArsR family regulator
MKYYSYELTCMKRGLTETCYLFFGTLANPTRLAILEALDEGPKSVGEIAQKLKQEQSMISHNLRPLERCRFVFEERKKKQRIYSLNGETMKLLFKVLMSHSAKYCPTGNKCFSENKLEEHRKREASRQLRVTH